MKIRNVSPDVGHPSCAHAPTTVQEERIGAVGFQRATEITRIELFREKVDPVERGKRIDHDLLFS